jgi:hypothetical protein
MASGHQRCSCSLLRTSRGSLSDLVGMECNGSAGADDDADADADAHPIHILDFVACCSAQPQNLHSGTLYVRVIHSDIHPVPPKDDTACVPEC